MGDYVGRSKVHMEFYLDLFDICKTLGSIRGEIYRLLVKIEEGLNCVGSEENGPRGGCRCCVGAH
jgi:hypothetical protein